MAEEANDELEKLTKGIRETLLAERRAALTPEQADAADTPPAERNEVQRKIMQEIGSSLEVNQEDIAKAAPDDIRREAKKWAQQAIDAEQQDSDH